MPAPRKLNISLASNSCSARQSGGRWIARPASARTTACGPGTTACPWSSRYLGSKQASNLALSANSPARAGRGRLARPTHSPRVPGSLRRQRSVDRRGPVAGRADEGARPKPPVTNCMKGANMIRVAPEKAQSMPLLLDEPAADTLMVVLEGPRLPIGVPTSVICRRFGELWVEPRFG